MYQLVVTRKITSSAWLEPDRVPGDVVWVKDEGAVRHLLENGLCRWPRPEDEKQYGPMHVKPFGPQENKGAGNCPSEKAEGLSRPKFSGEAMAGRTIASPWSNPHGAARLSSASAAALVLPHRL